MEDGVGATEEGPQAIIEADKRLGKTVSGVIQIRCHGRIVLPPELVDVVWRVSVIGKVLRDECGQGRAMWMNNGLTPAAELRDCEDGDFIDWSDDSRCEMDSNAEAIDNGDVKMRKQH